MFWLMTKVINKILESLKPLNFENIYKYTKTLIFQFYILFAVNMKQLCCDIM